MQKRRMPTRFSALFRWFAVPRPIVWRLQGVFTEGREFFRVCAEVVVINFLILRVKIQYNEEKGLKAWCVPF